VETIKEAAREYKLDGASAPSSVANDDAARLVEAFQTLATLMDKLRRR
jgi:hypothetical protein